MSGSNLRLRQFILEAVANDYEQFDSIVGDVRKWSAPRKEQFSAAEIQDGLTRLVREGSIGAYELSSKSDPRAIMITPEEIGSAWFYILPAGKRALGQFSEAVAAAR